MKRKLFQSYSSSTSSSTSNITPTINPLSTSDITNQSTTNITPTSDITNQSTTSDITNPLDDIKHEYEKYISCSDHLDSDVLENLIKFISDNNISASGNVTLLNVADFKKLQNFNLSVVLLKSTDIIGCVLSVCYPVYLNANFQKSYNEKSYNEKSYNYGYTTFLNLDRNYRSQNLCPLLIKHLIDYNYKKNITNGYQITSFPLSEKSLPLKIYYRPINLKNSLLAGFTYPNFNNVQEYHKHRLLYKTKMPAKYSVKLVKPSNKLLVDKFVNFYVQCITEKKKKFVMSLENVQEWITQYSTYIVEYNSEIIGLFSLNGLYSKTLMGNKIILAVPYLFVTKYKSNDKNQINKEENVLRCMLYVAEEKDYDLFYCHSIGDLCETLLKNVDCILGQKECYFSLYNSPVSDLNLSLDITSSDIHVPLF